MVSLCVSERLSTLLERSASKKQQQHQHPPCYPTKYGTLEALVIAYKTTAVKKFCLKERFLAASVSMNLMMDDMNGKKRQGRSC